MDRSIWLRAGLSGTAVGLALMLWPSNAAQAQNVTYSEFRFGILDHDARFLGGKEKGVDINPEVNWQSPISDAWASTVPYWIRWAVQPRPTIGGEINTDGFTNQAYIGANWAWRLTSNVFQPGDGIILGYFFGPGFNDGKVSTRIPDRKALGSFVLFREALDLGYEFTPGWQISAFIDHVSNGGLAKQNQSINDVGARLGVRF
jgi:lipid A 3-O-deacylase